MFLFIDFVYHVIFVLLSCIWNNVLFKPSISCNLSSLDYDDLFCVVFVLFCYFCCFTFYFVFGCWKPLKVFCVGIRICSCPSLFPPDSYTNNIHNYGMCDKLLANKLNPLLVVILSESTKWLSRCLRFIPIHEKQSSQRTQPHHPATVLAKGTIN